MRLYPCDDVWKCTHVLYVGIALHCVALHCIAGLPVQWRNVVQTCIVFLQVVLYIIKLVCSYGVMAWLSVYDMICIAVIDGCTSDKSKCKLKCG